MNKKKHVILTVVLVFVISILVGAGAYFLGNNVYTDSHDVKILGYNVQVGWSGDWRYDGRTYTFLERAELLLDAVEELRPDSIGFIESDSMWLTMYEHRLKEYAYVGDTDTGNGNEGFGAYIFYLKNKYTVVDSGSFWLSETPDVPGSHYAGADRPRNASWAILKNKVSGLTYAHITTHVCWQTTNNANGFGSSVVAQYAEKFAEQGYPVFVTGDFNTIRDTEAYPAASNMTANGVFLDANTEKTPTHVGGSYPLDYCFYTGKDIVINSFKVAGDFRMSDHQGVYVEATIKR